MMDGSFFPGIGDYYGDQEDTSFLKETDISKTTVIVNCIQVALFYFIRNFNNYNQDIDSYYYCSWGNYLVTRTTYVKLEFSCCGIGPLI